MNKCQGCGILLQVQNSSLEGYTKNSKYPICERCFRIQHYSDYQKSFKKNEEYIKILDNIKDKKSLVVLVVDLFYTISIENIVSYLTNDILLVLTKRDLLPYSLYEEKIIQYFEDKIPNIKETIIISSKNNYHFDSLYQSILKYKKRDSVYVIGYTNAGKSSMINKLIYHYSDLDSTITTSMLPSTTLDTIEIKINDEVTIIDTPGLLFNDSIISNMDNELLKRITPSKEIKPKIYQIKENTFFQLEDLFCLEIVQKGDVVFYFSEELKLRRIYKKPLILENFIQHDIKVNKNEDLVITEIGFIKFKEEMNIKLYLPSNYKYYTRKQFI